MDIDGFWALIEESRAATTGPDDRAEWLTDKLAALPPRDIEDFQIHLDEQRRRVDSWLVGLGPETLSRVAEDPDNLADVPEIRRLAGRSTDEWAEDEWPDWEILDYVADTAHERRTGEEESLDDALAERDHESPTDAEPEDDRWDFEDAGEVARRFPRLAAMFPLTDRAVRDARGKAAFDELLRERGQTEAEFFAEMEGQPTGTQDDSSPGSATS